MVMRNHINIDDQIRFIKAMLRIAYDEHSKQHLEAILKTLSHLPKNVD